jgi:hypothetical protein
MSSIQFRDNIELNPHAVHLTSHIPNHDGVLNIYISKNGIPYLKSGSIVIILTNPTLSKEFYSHYYLIYRREVEGGLRQLGTSFQLSSSATRPLTRQEKKFLKLARAFTRTTKIVRYIKHLRKLDIIKEELQCTQSL